MRRHLAAAVLVTSLVVAGCATGGPDQEGRAERPGTATLEVSNYNWSDMHVYVVAGGQRISLGLVTSSTTRKFQLPRTAFATDRNLIFVADPIGSRRAYASPGVHVQPGDRVEWRIQNNLVQSSISVF